MRYCSVYLFIFVRPGGTLLKQYFSWRPVQTADEFWIAVLKLLPYEITGAYAIILSGYQAAKGNHSVDFLFFAIVALSGFVFFLHRAATGASRISAAATGMLFFLFALSINAKSFHDRLVDATTSWPPLPYLLDVVVDPFPLLIAAILIVLATASLRKLLAKPPG